MATAISPELPLSPVVPRPRLYEAAKVWTAMLAVNAATAFVLSVVAHGAGEGRFASASAVLTFAFVLAVPAGAVQLSVARDVAAGRPVRMVPLRWTLAATAALLLAAPILTQMLGVSLAVSPVLVALVPASAIIAHRRGEALGAARFDLFARSSLVEAITRSVVGGALGYAAGADGVAVGVLAGLAAAALLTPSPNGRAPGAARVPMQLGDFSAATLVLAVSALLANIDLLVAPGMLGQRAADDYAAAAVPAKGILVALLVLSVLIVPYAERWNGVVALVAVPVGAIATGALLTGCLLLGRPFIADILGGRQASVGILCVLGLANGFAAATSVSVNLALVRGMARAWVRIVPGLLLILGSLPLLQGGQQLALATLGAQVVAATLLTVSVIRAAGPNGVVGT